MPDLNAVLALLQRETVTDEEGREMLGLPREKPAAAQAQSAESTEMFVALVQQGMVLDQKALAVGGDAEDLQRQASAEAERLNAAETGEAEGYSATVVRVGQ